MIIEIRKLFEDYWELKIHNDQLISFSEGFSISEEDAKKQAISYATDYISKGIDFNFVINK